jgi:hypothetical protein
MLALTYLASHFFPKLRDYRVRRAVFLLDVAVAALVPFLITAAANGVPIGDLNHIVKPLGDAAKDGVFFVALPFVVGGDFLLYKGMNGNSLYFRREFKLDITDYTLDECKKLNVTSEEVALIKAAMEEGARHSNEDSFIFSDGSVRLPNKNGTQVVTIITNVLNDLVARGKIKSFVTRSILQNSIVQFIITP